MEPVHESLEPLAKDRVVVPLFDECIWDGQVLVAIRASDYHVAEVRRRRGLLQDVLRYLLRKRRVPSNLQLSLEVSVLE